MGATPASIANASGDWNRATSPTSPTVHYARGVAFYVNYVDTEPVIPLDDRSARVLYALRRVPGGLRLTDLAAVNTSPLSSAQALVGSLERSGVVVRDRATRPRYRLAADAPAGAIEEIVRWRMPREELAQIDALLDTALAPAEHIAVPNEVRNARRTLLSLLARRTRPGAGSDLERLMKGEKPVLPWWAGVESVLKDIPHAAMGAVAANLYMAARGTDDLDVAVQLADLAAAEAVLRAAGWKPTATLSLFGGLRGKAWQDAEGHELDLIGLPGAWGRDAIATAAFSPTIDMRALALPFAVLTKMISSRGKDVVDISRMLGFLDDAALTPILVLIKRHMTAEDYEDVRQMVKLGRLEAGAARKSRKPARP